MEGSTYQNCCYRKLIFVFLREWSVSDDIATSRDIAFAKIEARVKGTKSAAAKPGG